MKKLFAILLIIATAFAVASCEKDPVSSSTTSGTTVVVPPIGTVVIEDDALVSAVGASVDGVYTVPDGITFICEGAFANDKDVREIIIPDSVKTIGSGAFSGCSNLKKINIPSGLSSLGAMAFYGCVSLEEITLPDALTSLLPYTFAGCSFLSAVTLGSAVSTIGAGCFAGCSSLDRISLPETLTSLGSSAFSGCVSLRSVDGFEKTALNYVSDMAFYGCESLKSISLPSGVAGVGMGAFMNCTRLAKITIPETVRDVSLMAFNTTPWYAENDETFFIVGDGVLIKSTYNPLGADEPGTLDLTGLGIKSIGNSCFANVAIAASLDVSLGYRYSANVKRVIVPEGVENIGSGAFFGCMNLEYVDLPSTLKTVGGSAFCEADGSSYSNADVSFEKCTSLTDIGSEAFFGCLGIEDVVLPESVVNIGKDAFTETAAYYNFIDDSAKTGASAFKTVGGSVLLWVYVPKGETNIVIPDKIKYIAGGACAGWDSNVVWDDYENDPDASEAIKLRHRFTYAIRSITIPEGVVYIGDGAFLRITGITSITLPDSLETLDSAAFAQCGSISAIKFGKNLKNIGSDAFRYASVKSVTLPESIVSLGGGAFADCSSLERLYIPKTISSVEQGIVSADMMELKTVYIPPKFRPYIFYIVNMQTETVNADLRIRYEY